MLRIPPFWLMEPGGGGHLSHPEEGEDRNPQLPCPKPSQRPAAW